MSAAAASGPRAPDPGAGPHRAPAEEHDASRGQSKADERRATERMDKAKKRPGYQKEAPAPRASSAAGVTR